MNDTSCHFLSLATSLKAGLHCKCNQQHHIRRNKELLIELKSKTGYFRIEVVIVRKSATCRLHYFRLELSYQHICLGVNFMMDGVQVGYKNFHLI